MENFDVVAVFLAINTDDAVGEKQLVVIDPDADVDADEDAIMTTVVGEEEEEEEDEEGRKWLLWNNNLLGGVDGEMGVIASLTPLCHSSHDTFVGGSKSFGKKIIMK